MDIVDEIVDGYLECAQWAEDPDEGSEWREAEWGYYERRRARITVMAFLYAARDIDLELWRSAFTAGRIGHDLWLTTHGHGAGFWDRYMEVPSSSRAAFERIGDELSAICDWPEFDRVGGGVELGDDGKLYIGG